MYSRTQQRLSQKTTKKKSLISIFLLSFLSFFAVKWFGGALAPKVAVADVQTEPVALKVTKVSETVAPMLAVTTEPAVQETAQTPPPAETQEEPIVEDVEVVEDTTVLSVTPAQVGYPVVLSNGNTAGPIGTEAAARMAAATGVPQETWEYIIARESNGDPNVANPSGASGLFQTMPGWGSTATVDDQINAALNAYNHQGLAAWSVE